MDEPPTIKKTRGRPKGSTKSSTAAKKDAPPVKQKPGPSDSTTKAAKTNGKKEKPKKTTTAAQFKQQAAEQAKQNASQQLGHQKGFEKSLSEMMMTQAEQTAAGKSNLPGTPGQTGLTTPFGPGMAAGAVPVYPKEDWKGIEASGQLRAMTGLASAVRILDTGEGSGRCKGQESCFTIVQNLQKQHMQEGLYDINYNFLIGDDGSVYIGRDWVADCDRPAEYKHLNGDCFDIALIGDFSKTEVPANMLMSAYNMVAYGYDKKKIKKSPRVLRNIDFTDQGILDKCLQQYFDKVDETNNNRVWHPNQPG